MAMRTLLLYFTTLFMAGFAVEVKHLHVKFALWNGYYDMPKTVAEAKEEKYVLMDHDDELNVDLYSYPQDPRVSILFDTHGNIAGLRTAYIKEDVPKKAMSKNTTFLFNYDDKPIFSNGTYWGKDVWYTSVLFTSPDKLWCGGRSDTKDLVAESIYIKLDGNWTRIPENECNAEALGFTKQACVIGMGMHYFYKVTPTSDCKDIQGVFLLYERGELIGLGFNPFGAFTSEDRVWFEDFSSNIFKPLYESIGPNFPACATDWASTQGATFLHVFFKRVHRLTICTWPWQKSDQCKNNNE